MKTICAALVWLLFWVLFVPACFLITIALLCFDKLDRQPLRP